MRYIDSGWSGFCGGNVLHSFGEQSHPHYRWAEGKTARELLLSIASTNDRASFTMADAEGGVVDNAIFSQLDNSGTIEGPADYKLGYTLSPFFYNPNSGNQCRVLFVWKEYSEAFIDGRNEEIERENNPPEYEDDSYDDDY